MGYFAAVEDYMSTFVDTDREPRWVTDWEKKIAAFKEAHRVKPDVLNSDAVATDFLADPTGCTGAGKALSRCLESKQGLREGVKLWLRQSPSMESSSQWGTQQPTLLTAEGAEFLCPEGTSGERTIASTGDYSSQATVTEITVMSVVCRVLLFGLSWGANEIMHMKLLFKLWQLSAVMFCYSSLSVVLSCISSPSLGLKDLIFPFFLALFLGH